MTRESLFDTFNEIGRDLFVSRLITSHGGNLSVRDGEMIYITRTGCELAHLSPEDIVEVSALDPDERDAQASCELVVHRAIYHAREKAWGQTSGAIVHAHSPETTVRSFFDHYIEPWDSEAQLITPAIPVVTAPTTIGSAQAGAVLAEALSQESSPDAIAVLHGHGPFACGATLKDAYRLVSVVEHSCFIINRTIMLGTSQASGI